MRNVANSSDYADLRDPQTVFFNRSHITSFKSPTDLLIPPKTSSLPHFFLDLTWVFLIRLDLESLSAFAFQSPSQTYCILQSCVSFDLNNNSAELQVIFLILSSPQRDSLRKTLTRLPKTGGKVRQRIEMARLASCFVVAHLLCLPLAQCGKISGCGCLECDGYA